MNGNPAMEVIYLDAIERIDKGEELAPVQKVVLREWTIWATARVTGLELKSQRGFLTDEEYADMASLKDQIVKIAPHI